jgi:hypothetical protein
MNRIVDEYKRPDGEEITLSTDGERWQVDNWGINGTEHRWSVSGVNEGGTSDGFRTIGGTWKPFDEAAARVEFERWRT